MPSTDFELSPKGHALAVVFAVPLAEVLRARGLDILPLLEHSAIDPDCLTRANVRIPLDKVDLLWRLAFEATGDEAIAIEVAQRLHPGSLSVLSFALYSSVTLQDMTERLARYLHVVTNAASIHCEILGDTFQVIGEPTRPTTAPLRSIVFFASIVRLWRDLSRVDLRPIRFSLQGVAPPVSPDTALRLEAFFGCEIDYDAPANQLVLSRDEALKPLPAANPELARRGEDIIREYLADVDRSQITPQVTMAIVSELSSGDFGMQKIADRLGIGARTLQRRLQSEGVTFKDILDMTRRDLAERYVQEGHRPIKEIAYLLGFSDLSNFTRAFRTWFGAPPKAFRDAARQPE